MRKDEIKNYTQKLIKQKRVQLEPKFNIQTGLNKQLIFMIDNNPLISVIANCYNGEKYLKELVQSLFDQSYTNWELIFWDNYQQIKVQKLLRSLIKKSNII